MSQLGVILQESLRAEREARTILGLLTDQMDGVDSGPRRRRTLKERLRFTGMGCCGAAWVFRPATLSVRHEQEEQEGRTHSQQQQEEANTSVQDPNPNGPECVGPNPSGSGMNLAAALAAERQLRGAQEPDGGGEGSTGETRTAPGTPWRVSLMRLLEEAEGGDAEVAVVTETERWGGEGAVGNDSVCCVCMGRKKGAAFIPCGHTYCRVCSRELWMNRGSCPLCNRSILDILDIF